MTALAAVAPLALLLAAAEGGGSWSCVASEQLDPRTLVSVQSTLREGGGGDLPNFHVSWTPEGSMLVAQHMNWISVPRGNERLGTPDTIGFSIPVRKPDRKGHLRFQAGAQYWTIAQGPGIMRSLRPIGGSWVEFQRWIERNEFWKGSGWKVDAIDRRQRVMGATEIRLPAPDKVQAAYARLRFQLARVEADPAGNCRYSPPPEPSDSDIIVSDGSDPA